MSIPFLKITLSDAIVVTPSEGKDEAHAEIKALVTGYDTSESWMITKQRASKIAACVLFDRIATVKIDLPESHINLSKYIQHKFKDTGLDVQVMS